MQEINQQLNNVPNDRYERHKQKKATREAEISRSRRSKTLKKAGYLVIGLVVLVSGGWLLVSTTGPKGADYSQAYPVLGRNHIPDGSSASYNSNPPTSGDHYAGAAPVRFYDKELPDEQLVHNLEHGHVWISFKPGISEEVVSALKDLSGGFVIVTPRSKNDTNITLAAWGRLDKFNLESGNIDQQRIKDFVSRYKNKGPERVSVPQGHLR